MRAVLDPNVLIAALLASRGAPAQIVSRWPAGEFELVVSELLLAELERALAYSKIRARIASAEAAAFLVLLREGAVLAPDPAERRRRSADRDDDYLLALAESERALLVSGDAHLLDLGHDLPIQAPRAFLDALAP
ncbi:MAG: putative toxin-antitoxin system toxin component, PIN family [Actinomycetota bacterium]